MLHDFINLTWLAFAIKHPVLSVISLGLFLAVSAIVFWWESK